MKFKRDTADVHIIALDKNLNWDKMHVTQDINASPVQQLFGHLK